jgi:hypothetical protein
MRPRIVQGMGDLGVSLARGIAGIRGREAVDCGWTIGTPSHVADHGVPLRLAERRRMVPAVANEGAATE